MPSASDRAVSGVSFARRCSCARSTRGERRRMCGAVRNFLSGGGERGGSGAGARLGHFEDLAQLQAVNGDEERQQLLRADLCGSKVERSSNGHCLGPHGVCILLERRQGVRRRVQDAVLTGALRRGGEGARLQLVAIQEPDDRLTYVRRDAVDPQVTLLRRFPPARAPLDGLLEILRRPVEHHAVRVKGRAGAALLVHESTRKHPDWSVPAPRRSREHAGGVWGGGEHSIEMSEKSGLLKKPRASNGLRVGSMILAGRSTSSAPSSTSDAEAMPRGTRGDRGHRRPQTPLQNLVAAARSDTTTFLTLLPNQLWCKSQQGSARVDTSTRSAR